MLLTSLASLYFTGDLLLLNIIIRQRGMTMYDMILVQREQDDAIAQQLQGSSSTTDAQPGNNQHTTGNKRRANRSCCSRGARIHLTACGACSILSEDAAAARARNAAQKVNGNSQAAAAEVGDSAG